MGGDFYRLAVGCQSLARRADSARFTLLSLENLAVPVCKSARGISSARPLETHDNVFSSRCCIPFIKARYIKDGVKQIAVKFLFQTLFGKFLDFRVTVDREQGLARFI
jgi:hypothetical protein